MICSVLSGVSTFLYIGTYVCMKLIMLKLLDESHFEIFYSHIFKDLVFVFSGILGRYERENLLIDLPEGTKFSDYTYIGIAKIGGQEVGYYKKFS